MFALFYCRTKAIISLARVGRNGNCYKSHKVGSLLLHLGSGIKHYDTRIALIRFKRGFKHLSTSKKEENVDTFCLRLLQNVENGTFDIILRPHIARLFSIILFDFHSILSTSVIAVDQNIT